MCRHYRRITDVFVSVWPVTFTQFLLLENGTHEDFADDDFKISRNDIRFVDNDEGIEEDAREGEEKGNSPGRDGSTKSKKPKSDEDKELLDKITKDGLHGKLATAQLRSRTSKLEKSMTDQEREEVRPTLNLVHVQPRLKDSADRRS